ncbi:MAG: 1,4-alpha-glucan branching protein GlgB [Verrucomicrobia bacterium]|nr:1,4-alpha-glucan branching protein GlgB [Verrucomicrobiota bacterium]
MQILDTESPHFQGDPHRVLGLHGEGKRIRLWRPGAPYLHLEIQGKQVEANKVGAEGLFEYKSPLPLRPTDYRVYTQGGALVHDPYAFEPTVGEVDLFLFGKGVHYRLHEVMGGRLCTHQGVQGAKFAVWAPNARSVALVADFNFWDGRLHPLRRLGSSGVWELFVPGLKEGEKYKFEIVTEEGALLLKTDPFALYSEVRPKSASVLFETANDAWTDGKWMQGRKKEGPLNIYEVHLGSWKSLQNYREIAHALGDYCIQMGFTHVELMPLAEHPLDESWGYQVTGFFAVTSRFGSPRDFQYFVDHLHRLGIGVILDWVPAHFPSDGHALAQFDGSYLYEHSDPRQGFHPHWNTYIFNYGRHEVVNFLISSALFWLEEMHIDGLRVDAVASMLYLDYGRSPGEWIPNRFGGKENLEAIEFLKHLNSIVHEKFPTALMCAEESTSFTGVTHPLERGGLGFDLKWNMGWMNDTLQYFQKNTLFRSYHQNNLTFGILYAFSEKFILPFSHDEVVHGKASLLSKMPGDDWQKFANVRLIRSYQMCQPGKKLLFMGAELGMWEEWNCKETLPWHYLHYDRHLALHRFFQEMNQFYLQKKSLWEEEFEWVDCSDRENSVLIYLRKGEGVLLCVHNFSPNFHARYFVRLSSLRSVKEVFNTDREEYGGSGKINPQVEKGEGGCFVQLAPLATMIFEVEFVY